MIYIIKTKLVIFGIGEMYQKRKEKLNEIKDIHICAFLDNNENLWGTLLDDILVYSPQELNNIQYDYIVLMSVYATEMYGQLRCMGVDKNKILYYEEFFAKFSKKWKLYRANIKEIDSRNSILIVTTNMNYNGGTMTAIYAAKCLQSKNYKVDLCTPYCDSSLIREINEYGIDVIVYDSLPYIQEEKWIHEYSMVIVNVLQMIQCACEISKYKPVLWWIHEPSFFYDPVLKQFSDYADKESVQYIDICAVSNIAKLNFNNWFPDKVKKILHYGIPDMCSTNKPITENKKIVFAIIGGISELKAQDVFLKVANQIETDGEAEFWIIGKLSKTVYGNHIVEVSKHNSNIKIRGQLSRKEIYDIFPQIDVVVCASYEETMSIAIIEGMMFKKVCITTDNTGIADYIVDGENGFIVPVGDVEALYNRMQWIIEHRDQTERISNNARKTYEKYFTMEVFGENLERAVNETINKWEERTK